MLVRNANRQLYERVEKFGIRAQQSPNGMPTTYYAKLDARCLHIYRERQIMPAEGIPQTKKSPSLSKDWKRIGTRCFKDISYGHRSEQSASHLRNRSNQSVYNIFSSYLCNSPSSSDTRKDFFGCHQIQDIP